jgi:hypothetical protein
MYVDKGKTLIKTNDETVFERELRFTAQSMRQLPSTPPCPLASNSSSEDRPSCDVIALISREVRSAPDPCVAGRTWGEGQSECTSLVRQHLYNPLFTSE